MSALMHAVLIEGGGYEKRMAKALDILKGHFADDPAAAAKLDAGTFEDLLFIEPEEDKEIKVEHIKGLIDLFNQKPFASTGKACIITKGERMNEYAQNKLLKLLEEPQGGDVIVILAENAEALLATVRSRVMRIWLGYAEPEKAAPTDDLRKLLGALILGKGSIAEANSILTRYDGSREEAKAFLSAFQLLLRSVSVGRFSAALIGEGAGREWAEAAAGRINQGHADKMREGVLFAEKALIDIERGYRVRYVLRRMALSMRADCLLI